MAQERVSGVLQLTVTRDGDVLSGILLHTNSLEQQYDPDSGAYNPDWSVDANRPVIFPNVTSALKGGVITGTDNFKNINVIYNGTQIVANGAVVEGQTNNWELITYSNVPALKRKVNIGQDAAFNLIFNATVNNGSHDSQISLSTSLSRTTISRTTYVVHLETDNGGIVDANTSPVTNCILTPRVMLGADAVTSGIYLEYFWLDDGEWKPFGTAGNTSITVTPADIDGSDSFKVVIRKSNASGIILASDTRTVIDNSDAYQMTFENASGGAVPVFAFNTPSQTIFPKVKFGNNDVTNQFDFTAIDLYSSNGDVLKSGNTSDKNIVVSYDDIKEENGAFISADANKLG